MQFINLIVAVLMLSSCKLGNPNNQILDHDASSHGLDHQHYHSNGGPLLGGYPWGVFDLQMEFNKRFAHKKNDQELTLSNRIFESLGTAEIETTMVAFPLSLDHKGYKPFGDGQSNGRADFASWGFQSPPYIALLRKKGGAQTLLLLLHKNLNLGSTKTISWTMGNNPVEQKSINTISSKFPKSITSDYTKMVQFSVTATNWEKRTDGVFAFFKPSNWQDWFAVHFQNPYVSIDKVISAVPKKYKSFNTLHGERSSPNPMKIKSGMAKPPLIQLMEKYKDEDYLVFPADKVHSLYPSPNTPDTVEKTVGGNWTFLLKQEKWENSSSPDTFKQLYSCFPGRMYWEESIKKAISGTSWHHVGDPGEFLLNSIDGEKRSLITAIGIKVPTSLVTNGGNLAFNLQYIGYSGFLEPGFAFISVKNQFHWHPIHTIAPICIEVWRPFCDVTKENKYGMQCTAN